MQLLACIHEVPIYRDFQKRSVNTLLGAVVNLREYNPARAGQSEDCKMQIAKSFSLSFRSDYGFCNNF